MQAARLIATVWLVAVGAFFWGFSSERYHYFPYRLVVQNFEYFDGSDELPTTLWQKIINDLNIAPERWISTFNPTGNLRELKANGLNPRRASPKIFLSDPTPAFRLIVGVFDFKDAFWGAILVDEKGAVVHTWKLAGELPEFNKEPDIVKFLYGVTPLPDGSIIYNMNNYSTLIKRDVCSNLSWVHEGNAHHVVSPSEDYHSFWTFLDDIRTHNPTFAEINSQTGATIRTFSVSDIQKQNPGLYIFDLRRINMQPAREGLQDIPHPNDIEPLPAQYADAFPGFKAGDLAVSYRTSNLVYVVDPDTLKVKFWYFGAGDGLHDIDWQPDGTLTLFSNNWRSLWNDTIAPYSSIISIDPKSGAHRTLIDGQRYNLFTPVIGRHQKTPHNSFLISSGVQGRALEINADTGETIFEFVNSYNKEKGQVLMVSEAFHLTKDFFKIDMYAVDKCAKH